IQPVGAGRVEKVNVRVVAATNRDLMAEARAGRFREDLYYRLAVGELVGPPLREHREDIPALVAAFVRQYGERFAIDPPGLPPVLLERLKTRDWPGNVRQLENTIARVVAMTSGGEVSVECFEQSETGNAAAQEGPREGLSLREQVEALERNAIARTMAAVGNNQSEAARQRGLSRGALIERLKKYGLTS